MSTVILLFCFSSQSVGGLGALNYGSLEDTGDLFKIPVYEGEPEEYVTFCFIQAKKALLTYFGIRQRHGEAINESLQ